MPENIKEAIHRGNNLLMVAFLAVLGVGAITLAISEDELLDKADDLFFVVLGIIAIGWYLRGRNRYHFSWTPFILVALGLVGKVLALINEFGDPAAVGDEYGYVSIMVIVTVISTVLLVHARRMEQVGEPTALPQNAIPQTGGPEDKNTE